MSVARFKLLLLPVFLILAFSMGTLMARETTKPKEVKAQSSTDVPPECGEQLADYMNAIIEGAGDLPGIQLTSPVFNLTNPREYQIWLSMASAGADWDGLSAFAGNTYRISGRAPYNWYNPNPLQGDTNPNWRDLFDGRSVIFTEFGNYDEANGPGSQNVATMQQDFNSILFDNTVLAAIYFNAFQTDTGLFAGFGLSPNEFNQIISSSSNRGGANSGQPVRGRPDTWARVMRGEIPVRPGGPLYNSSAEWSVEILYNRDDAGAAIQAAEAAFDRNITPVFRLCDAVNSCGFEDPQDVVALLRELSAGISSTGRNVYVVAGPNEPATEGWAAPACLGEVTEPDEITPFEIVDIPCNATYRDPGQGRPTFNDGREFHSLRPYPASPCDREFNPEIQTYMCGNALIARQVYEVMPEDATGFDGFPPCQDVGGGAQLCRYQFNSSTRIWMDLTDAELPIAGNTELVPNAESANSNGLSFAQRVNEYVSWYLNGTTQRAEETDELELEGNSNLAENLRRVNEIINFSGPIKKLLPILSVIPPAADETQVGLRTEQRAQANQSRHNQIAVCAIADNFRVGGNSPLRCYRDERTGSVRWRLTQLNAFFPWFVGGFYRNPLFGFIPFSSTEDLVGRTRTDLTNSTYQPGEGRENDPGESTAATTNRVFTPSGAIQEEDGRPYHTLYFAHMEEDTQLAEYLQQTYLPEGMTGLENLEDANADVLRGGFPYCEIVESRTNPGDDLYGEYANGRAGVAQPEPTPPSSVSGVISYTARFSCLFPPLVADPQCLANCGTLPPEAQAGCFAGCEPEREPCEKNALVSMDVHVLTPRGEDLWSRLVMGAESIFRRMMPQVTPGAPFEEIINEPAYTDVDYGAAPFGSNPSQITSTSALAGDPEENRPGSRARLYFPHLGSIHEYFLQQMQIALRPYNLGGPPPVDVSPDCTPLESTDELDELLPPVNPSCLSTNCSGINVSLSPALERIIGSAASFYNVPASVLLGILYNEGGLNPGGSGALGSNLDDDAVLAAAGPNCGIPDCDDPGGSYRGAMGPWQFLYGTWNANSGAVTQAGVDDGRVPNVCNIVDATFAAARKISRESVGTNYPYALCAGERLNTGTQGSPTSCSWDASRAVTAAKQYYGLCMDPVNQGALNEFLDYPVVFGGDRNNDGSVDTQDVLDWMAGRNCTPTNTGPCYQYSVLYWFNQCQP